MSYHDTNNTRLFFRCSFLDNMTFVHITRLFFICSFLDNMTFFRYDCFLDNMTGLFFRCTAMSSPDFLVLLINPVDGVRKGIVSYCPNVPGTLNGEDHRGAFLLPPSTNRRVQQSADARTSAKNQE